MEWHFFKGHWKVYCWPCCCFFKDNVPRCWIYFIGFFMVPWASVWWLFPPLNNIYGMNQFHALKKIIKFMLVSLLLLLSDVIFNFYSHWVMLSFIYWINLSFGALGSNIRCMVAEAWWKCINALIINKVFNIFLWMVPLVIYFFIINFTLLPNCVSQAQHTYVQICSIQPHSILHCPTINGISLSSIDF